MVHDPRPADKIFFVDGLGRASKTFLYGCLLRTTSVRLTRQFCILIHQQNCRVSKFGDVGELQTCRSVPDRARPGTPHGGRLTGLALFGAWEILGYGFQDMVFRTWDLNFGAWIFTLTVSKIKT